MIIEREMTDMDKLSNSPAHLVDLTRAEVDLQDSVLYGARSENVRDARGKSAEERLIEMQKNLQFVYRSGHANNSLEVQTSRNNMSRLRASASNPPMTYPEGGAAMSMSILPISVANANRGQKRSRIMTTNQESMEMPSPSKKTHRRVGQGQELVYGETLAQ